MLGSSIISSRRIGGGGVEWYEAGRDSVHSCVSCKTPSPVIGMREKKRGVCGKSSGIVC